MGIRKYKPTTPGRRGSSVADFVEVTRTTPEKSLVKPLPKKGGRNNQGRITSRHQGGGHKRAYRIIDFRRYDKDGVPAKVAHIEYDPNRTANIALLHYADGEKRYIIAPKDLKQGARVESGVGADIKPGNNLPLRNIPTGTTIHAVELRPDHVAFLKAQGLAETIWEGDFLEVEPQRVYDGVIMNPPFARGDDMRHVLHALKFVRPGGRLAAVVSQCFTFHKGKIVDAFLAAIEKHQGQVVKLPPGTFAHVGTQMETAIVVFDVAA